jgi:hypothetical protein
MYAGEERVEPDPLNPRALTRRQPYDQQERAEPTIDPITLSSVSATASGTTLRIATAAPTSAMTAHQHERADEDHQRGRR